MKRLLNLHRAKLLDAFGAFAFAASLFAVGAAVAATPRVDEGQLLTLGFKVLVATTPVQVQWVQGLPAGKIKAMQRNGKKYFIYPDASRKQIYVGGPAEYDAYLKLHPASQQSAKDAAEKATYLTKEDQTMRAASARDMSNPFFGASWADLGW